MYTSGTTEDMQARLTAGNYQALETARQCCLQEYPEASMKEITLVTRIAPIRHNGETIRGTRWYVRIRFSSRPQMPHGAEGDQTFYRVGRRPRS